METVDTIAAISTALGEGGIAIVRVSGPESLTIADKIFKCKPPLPSERHAPALVYGHVVSGGSIIDESILLIMRAPHSYTREDIVEFQCHGGTVCGKRILRAVLELNARIAEPGEFTKKAFLNGRLDLLQAEAVLDMIKAQSDRSASIALEQLGGALSRSFSAIYDNILGVCSDFEASLDFSEDDLSPAFYSSIYQRLGDINGLIINLLNTWEEGHVLRQGASVVISGRPNTGKSTLFNAIMDRDRVIVSPIPGTTRDFIEETFLIEGIPIRLIDTAGLSSTNCHIEQAGITRARNLLQSADIIIYVIDVSRKLSDEDYTTLKPLDPKKTIVVLNKTDLNSIVDINYLSQFDVVSSQAINNQGITTIKSMIIKKMDVSSTIIHPFAISERHRAALIAAKQKMDLSINLIKSSTEENLIPVISYLKESAEIIGQLIGKVYSQDLLDSIFNKFCIGK